MTDMSWIADVQSKPNREWIENWAKRIEHTDIPGDFALGERVMVDQGDGTYAPAIVLGAMPAADGTRWLAMRGLGETFPAWCGPVDEVRKMSERLAELGADLGIKDDGS